VGGDGAIDRQVYPPSKVDKMAVVIGEATKLHNFTVVHFNLKPSPVGSPPSAKGNSLFMHWANLQNYRKYKMLVRRKKWAARGTGKKFQSRRVALQIRDSATLIS